MLFVKKSLFYCLGEGFIICLSFASAGGRGHGFECSRGPVDGSIKCLTLEFFRSITYKFVMVGLREIRI